MYIWPWPALAPGADGGLSLYLTEIRVSGFGVLGFGALAGDVFLDGKLQMTATGFKYRP